MDDNQTPNPYRSPSTRDPEPPPQPGPRQTSQHRPANFSTVMNIGRELWRKHRSTLLSAWSIVAGFWLLGSLVTGIGGTMLIIDADSQQGVMPDTPAGDGNPLAYLDMLGPGYWGLLGLSVVLGFIQAGVGMASYAPIRRAWMEGRNLSTWEVLSEMGTRIIPGALLYVIFTIGFTVGAILCCIPGLLVGYFMLPTFYLVGGRGDGVFESLSTSLEWSKKYVDLLAMLIGVGILVGLGMGCIGGVTGQFFEPSGKASYLISQLGSWLVGVTLGFFIWLHYAGTMLTIEQAEQAELAEQAEQRAAEW